MASITELWIHPIKSLAPVAAGAVRVLPSGALEHDRRWALFDAGGRFINGKNRPAIHQLRVEYDLGGLAVSVAGRVYSLERQRQLLEQCFSEQLNEPLTLRENAELGFPDDTASPGPTFLSRASLEAVAEWFELELDQTRPRFRTNVEFEGAEPFWEDRLYGHAFEVGAQRFFAVNPCQRCAVPSRDAQTGVPISGFQKRFMQKRKEHLPPAAEAKYFDHHYRLAVNTRLVSPAAGGVLRRGDSLQFDRA